MNMKWNVHIIALVRVDSTKYYCKMPLIYQTHHCKASKP